MDEDDLFLLPSGRIVPVHWLTKAYEDEKIADKRLKSRLLFGKEKTNKSI